MLSFLTWTKQNRVESENSDSDSFWSKGEARSVDHFQVDFLSGLLAQPWHSRKRERVAVQFGFLFSARNEFVQRQRFYFPLCLRTDIAVWKKREKNLWFCQIAPNFGHSLSRNKECIQMLGWKRGKRFFVRSVETGCFSLLKPSPNRYFVEHWCQRQELGSLRKFSPEQQKPISNQTQMTKRRHMQNLIVSWSQITTTPQTRNFVTSTDANAVCNSTA